MLHLIILHSIMAHSIKTTPDSDWSPRALSKLLWGITGRVTVGFFSLKKHTIMNGRSSFKITLILIYYIHTTTVL